MARSSKQSLADVVFDKIHGAILSGKLYPGEVISEEQLAIEYNVSRTPIREALRRLDQCGLVVMNPRSHTTVAHLVEQETIDLANVRNNLEQMAIRAITPERLARHLHKLSRSCADCLYYLSLGERSNLLLADSVFHQQLVDAAENGTLSDIYERLDLKIQLLRMTQHPTTEDLGLYVNQHAKILENLRIGDLVSASNLLRDHIIHDLDNIEQNRFNL